MRLPRPTVRQAARTVDQFLRLAKAGRIQPKSMLGRLVCFVHWLAKDQAYIRDIHKQTIPLHPNAAQLLLLQSWMLQAASGRPIRTAILKARKLGASTFVQALAYYLCKHYRNQRALMLAHQGDATEEIFDIAQWMGRNDPVSRPRQTLTSLRFFPEGSHYSCHTAGGYDVGAGGTPNILHRSELALWRPERRKRSEDATVGNAVPRTPETIIVDESTARGQELFWSRFKAAHQPDHPFEPVFLPWFLDDRLKAPVQERRGTDDAEQVIIATGITYGIEVSPEQLAWRQQKIDEIGLVTFKQEYPSTPEEAIESQQGLVLPGLHECLVDRLPFDYSRVDVSQRTGGWDHGYRDPTALISSVYWDQVLYIIDVHRGRGELAEHHAEYVMPNHRYYCDPAALQARKELQAECQRIKTGARFEAAPRLTSAKRIGDRALTKDEWEAVRRMVEQGRLKILDTCADQILLEADNLYWNDQTGEPDKVRCPVDSPEDWGHFDTLDALRYNVRGVLMGDHTPQRAIVRERKPSRREMLRA